MSSLETTVPKGSWVLVTGVNGWVGSHVAQQFLERGYKVRGTVRDPVKSSWLVDSLFKSHADRGDFELVRVTDMAEDHAFDVAVKGVSIIEHVASVLSFDPDPNKVIPTTVKGVESLLQSALKEPSVKEFVYTSSILAATMPSPSRPTHVDRNTWNETAMELAWAPPPYDPSRGSPVYMASKVAAEKAFWAFVVERKPHFTANVVSPGLILGEPLNRSQSDSPAWLLKSLYDGKTGSLTRLSPFTGVDVKDVALLHVAAALDPEVKDARLQAWGNYGNWDQVLAIARKLYPNLKWAGDFTGGATPSLTTDETQVIALLKKWGNQDGWRPLEVTISEGLKSLVAWYPRE
ncbi:NAD(P)-binding protein [Achaetomium macrosporum]|uniref:NAD(P)-binding protein n=1 Tax=Achaetomium macrosporum TaxID=79813 RepID=A0AAN7CG96_9PEZI|nr:NAD(P)-binding protein [Achaetomium macrosporum]